MVKAMYKSLRNIVRQEPTGMVLPLVDNVVVLMKHPHGIAKEFIAAAREVYGAVARDSKAIARFNQFAIWFDVDG